MLASNLKTNSFGCNLTCPKLQFTPIKRCILPQEIKFLIHCNHCYQGTFEKKHGFVISLCPIGNATRRCILSLSGTPLSPTAFIFIFIKATFAAVALDFLPLATFLPGALFCLSAKKKLEEEIITGK